MGAPLLLVVLLAGLLLGGSDALVRPKDLAAVPAREAAAELSGCAVSCENPAYCCNSGYFCVRNALCLRGAPSDYEDAAFIGVGVLLGIISSVEHVSLSSQCVDDVFASVDTALSTFNDWDHGNHEGAMGDLRTLFGDLEKTWNACRSSESEPWWERLINVAVKIVSDFFPEVKVVEEGVEIILHGEDIYGDYERMREYCTFALLQHSKHPVTFVADPGQSYAGWVNCGIGIGDFGYQIYELLSDVEDGNDDDDDDDDGHVVGASSVRVTVYSDNACSTQYASVTAPLNQCMNVPICPSATCQQVLGCMHGEQTLQELLTCLGCSSPSNAVSLEFTTTATEIVETFFLSATCGGSAVESMNTTLNSCIQDTSLNCAGAAGSAMITTY